MTDVKIDEKALRRLHDLVKVRLKKYEDDLEKLIDKDEDIFVRYMSFAGLHYFFYMSDVFFKLSHDNFILGFDLNHEVFKTKKLAKHGFDEINIEENPFFINEVRPSLAIEKILDKILEEVEAE